MLPKTASEDLSDREMHVVDVLERRSEIRRRDIEEALDIPGTKASHLIHVLKDREILKSHGSEGDMACSTRFKSRCEPRDHRS